MNKKKILFLCVHNAARSQMAEAILNQIGSNEFEAESAGFEPTQLNPLAIYVMKEAGIDISKNKTKEVFDLYKQGKIYNYVISVCDESVKERCPIFPGMSAHLNWSFPNPANFTGTEEEKLNRTREIRDAIKEKIEQFIKDTKEDNV